MVQSGFAIFFLLAACCGAFSLMLTAREHFDAIAAALTRSDPPERVAAPFRTFERPTRDVPHVARRLRSLFDGDLRPVTETPRIWAFRRADPGLTGR